MHVRSLFAVALAALLVGPSSAHAAAQKQAAPAKAAPATASSSPQQFSLGGWIGYESGDLSGLQLRVDGFMPYKKIHPQVGLSFVGSIGYSYLTESAFGVDVTANVLKFVPAARFTLPVNPQLSFFGDAGLGLYWAGLSTKVDFGPLGSTTASDSSVGFMLRFGVGGLYALNPKTSLGVALMLDPMFGDYDDATFSFLAGATFKL